MFLHHVLSLCFHPQLEEAWLDDEHSEFLEQLKMEMLEEQQREEMELAALQEEQEKQQVRGNACVGPTIFFQNFLKLI